MRLTRRGLVNGIARLGGAGAVYETLAAWGFLEPPPAIAASFELPKDSGNGKTVAVLGAGVAGLCAAYELDRAGYDCVVIEPTRRVGGRSLTLRRGDSFKEMGDSPLQTCEFDEGLYLNAGPGRIPHHHQRVIDYCRQFGVKLEPYIFASRANLVHTAAIGNGKTMQIRQPLYDLQGYVAELLDKCSNKAGLEFPVSGTDVEKLHEMLVKFGNLTKVDSPNKPPSWVYKNASGHSGYEIPPGRADQPGKPLSPMALEELLRSNVWNDWIYRDNGYSWQASLLQPVGGMDMFVRSFARQPLTRQTGSIEGLVRFGARVTAINVANDRVTVVYWDRGSQFTLHTDYCISTIPAPVLSTLETNLPDDVKRAVSELPVMAAGKVGWQAERFWETKDQIYGGISWTSDIIDQIWYPSDGFLGRKGTLTGAYMRGVPAEEFNKKTLAERLSLAKDAGEKLHSGFSSLVEHGVAIGWNNMEFARLGWANESDKDFQRNALILAKPQGRLLIAGDQVTFWSGWQEGAIISAWDAVKWIDHQEHPTTRGLPVR